MGMANGQATEIVTSKATVDDDGPCAERQASPRDQPKSCIVFFTPEMNKKSTGRLSVVCVIDVNLTSFVVFFTKKYDCSQFVT